uniref:Uncharacterized protein n=1 Tax=Helianthus annuus TaxID=4232 RepID=A0A251UKR4_HELAN
MLFCSYSFFSQRNPKTQMKSDFVDSNYFSFSTKSTSHFIKITPELFNDLDEQRSIQLTSKFRKPKI